MATKKEPLDKSVDLRGSLLMATYGYSLLKFTELKKWFQTTPNVGKKSTKKILAFRLDGSFYKLFNSIGEAERELNINHSSIFLCCNNKQKYSKGFIFKYAE